jgi:hypothetical protein
MFICQSIKSSHRFLSKTEYITMKHLFCTLLKHHSLVAKMCTYHHEQSRISKLDFYGLFAQINIICCIHLQNVIIKVAGVKVYLRHTWNFRSHAVSACIGLWHHRLMHPPHRLMHACTACIIPWRHTPMHPVTAWALLFWFHLRYTFISSYFGDYWLSIYLWFQIIETLGCFKKSGFGIGGFPRFVDQQHNVWNIKQTLF